MKIKQIPEDFIVKERINLRFFKGSYSYFKLIKKDWNTSDAVKMIAERLGANFSFFGYAGNKDRKGVTEQVISVYKIPKERVENLNIRDIKLEFLGYGQERIHLGELDGNDFIITVRDLNKKVKIKRKKIKNYYDEQRFGIKKNNNLVGLAILKKEFKKACELIDLEVYDNNYANALRKLNKKMLRFYIHAYQSHLFNNVLDKIKKNCKRIPVVGFLTKFKDKAIERLYLGMLKKDDLILRDFIIPALKEAGSEGGERDVYVHLTKLKVEWDKDEINEGKLKAVVSFSLNKGEYATIVIKELFGKGI